MSTEGDFKLYFMNGNNYVSLHLVYIRKMHTERFTGQFAIQENSEMVSIPLPLQVCGFFKKGKEQNYVQLCVILLVSKFESRVYSPLIKNKQKRKQNAPVAISPHTLYSTQSKSIQKFWIPSTSFDHAVKTGDAFSCPLHIFKSCHTLIPQTEYKCQAPLNKIKH